MRFVRESVEMMGVSTVSVVGLCISMGLAGLTGIYASNSSPSGLLEHSQQQWLLAEAERDEGEPRRPGDGVNR